jgi:hypothetical protein
VWRERKREEYDAWVLDRVVDMEYEIQRSTVVEKLKPNWKFLMTMQKIHFRG